MDHTTRMFAMQRDPTLARRLLDSVAMRVAVAVVVLLLAPSLAAADRAAEQPVAESSEGAATAWAAGTTAFGLAFLATGAKDDSVSLIIAGTLFAGIGPSAGHLYAGDRDHVSRISLARIAALILVALGDSTRNQTSQPNCFDCEFDASTKLTGRGNAMIAIGAVTYATLAIYDIYDAHRAARRVNERARAARKPVRLVAPTLVPTANGAAPAIGFSGTF